MVSIETTITGDGYAGIPSFKLSLWLGNQGDETLILSRLYYELFTEPANNFLGSGEALMRGEGDNLVTVMRLFPQGEISGMASIFKLDERVIGIIDQARAGEDARFRINVYGDVRACQVDNEGRETTIYKKLELTSHATVSKNEWEKWVDSWINDQRVIMLSKKTVEKLDEILKKLDKKDYDQVIQGLIEVEEKVNVPEQAKFNSKDVTEVMKT